MGRSSFLQSSTPNGVYGTSKALTNLTNFNRGVLVLPKQTQSQVPQKLVKTKNLSTSTLKNVFVYNADFNGNYLSLKII